MPSSLPALSEDESDYYKGQAVELVQEYYKNLNLITGDSSMSYDQKTAIENDLISSYFTSSAVVYNDIPDTGRIQDMTIRDYLDELNLLYADPKSGITFSKPKIEVPDIDVAADQFFMDVSVERTIRCYGKPEYSSTKKLDYYIGFAPSSRDIKIYSITEHGEKQNSYIKATIQSNVSAVPVNQSTSTFPVNQPAIAEPVNQPASDAIAENSNGSVVFNITPSDAQVKVDGQNTYFVNGMSVTLPQGQHNIEISAPHCIRYIYTDYNIEAGAVNTINRDLVIKTGTLKLTAANSKASGGYVYIDGDSTGRMPLNYISLSEGLHCIQVFKDGYFAWKKNVRIETGQDIEQLVDLINIENTEDALRIISGVLYPRVAYISSPVNPAYVPLVSLHPVNNNITKSSKAPQANPANNNNNKSLVQPANPKAGNTQQKPAVQKPAQGDNQFYAPTNNSQTDKQEKKQSKSQQSAKKADEGWTVVEPDFSGKKESKQSTSQSNGQKSGQHSTQRNGQSTTGSAPQKPGRVKAQGNSSTKLSTVTSTPQRGYVPPPRKK
jgi:hypothetical protein